jgi:beta-lactam-binding protein with PASTA domain
MSTPNLVPNVIGKYYYDAQQAILAAAMLIAPPVWALSSTINPGYVISQSIAAGTNVNPQTPMTITVAGFPVTNQPGVVVPVP